MKAPASAVATSSLERYNSRQSEASTESLRVVTESPNTSEQQIMPAHRPILMSFLECSDDITLEAFYHEVAADRSNNRLFDTTSEKSTRDRMEVAIFKSDKNRSTDIFLAFKRRKATTKASKRRVRR